MTAPSFDDRWPALIVSAQKGDEQSMAELFRALQPQLLRYLRVCDQNAADDIASATWMDAARSIKTFSGDESAFRGWMFTITRRRLIDHQRRQARFYQGAEIEHTAAADKMTIDNAAAVAAANLVRNTLPPSQAEVVLLRTVAGLSVDEVAAAMDKTAAAVRVLQHRGLRTLSQNLTPQSFSEEVKQNV